MSISSVLYLAFVLAVILVYYLFPRKFQWCWLLIASAAFYCSYGPKLAVWLYGTAAAIYLVGLWLARIDGRCQAQLDGLDKSDRAKKKEIKQAFTRKKRVVVTLAAVALIGVWVVFKFTDLFLLTLNRLFSKEFSLFNLVLPLGISFYTFQAVGYVVDVYRGKCQAQRNPLKLALWLSFFPQMIQGPICRYGETAEQLFAGHRPEYRRIKFGLQLMLWGYFKKLVIADRVAAIATTVFADTGKYEGFALLLGLIAYTVQLYGDFSGGIDIITGAAQCLGVDMPVNFQRPYFSRSVAEYWRRWHITLGGWFRDYIFYPLSISKPAARLGKHTRKWFGASFGKMAPTYIALLLVWTMNGIWHGTGKQFVVYGFYQGLLIMLGMSTGPLCEKLLKKLKVNTDCFSWRLWQMLRTALLMVFGRLIYKASSLREAARVLKNIFTTFNPWIFTDGTFFKLGLEPLEMFILFVALLTLLTVSILQERGVRMRETIERQNLVFRWMLYIAAILAVVLFGVYGTAYNAADFIYANF